MQDWWDNDFHAYYTRTKATLTMECLEDTEALCLSLDDVNAIRTGLPKIEHFFLEKVIATFLAGQRSILSLMTSSVQDRYEQLAKQHPSLLQRLPQEATGCLPGCFKGEIKQDEDLNVTFFGMIAKTQSLEISCAA